MSDLTEFVSARLAEDEAVARDAGEGYPRALLGPSAHSHAFKWLPARVLAECEAKRHLLDEALVWGEGCLDVMARYMAEVYADHPDYDEAWRL